MNKPIHQEFHDRARNSNIELSKQLLNLAIASVGGLFYLAINHNISLNNYQKTVLMVGILLFGISILFFVLALQWDASRNYFLGKINDPEEITNRDFNIEQKKQFQVKQKRAKNWGQYLFLAGMAATLIFMFITLFYY